MKRETVHLLLHRAWRIGAITAASYLLIFVLLGKADVSWMLPWEKSPMRWPDLPFFSMNRHPGADGSDEIRYTVPTRQITPREERKLDAQAGSSPAARVKDSSSAAPSP